MHVHAYAHLLAHTCVCMFIFKCACLYEHRAMRAHPITPTSTHMHTPMTRCCIEPLQFPLSHLTVQPQGLNTCFILFPEHTFPFTPFYLAPSLSSIRSRFEFLAIRTTNACLLLCLSNKIHKSILFTFISLVPSMCRL